MIPYELIVFVHIAAAVSLLSGSVFGSPAVRAAVRRARTTQEMRAYLAIGRPLLLIEPLSALIVLATGIYLAHVANFWSQGWVQVPLVFWFVNSVVAVRMVKPVMSRVAAEAAATRSGPVGQRLDALRRSARWSFGGDLLLANDAAMLYLMTLKPGLDGSLLVVAGTNVIVAVARVIGTRVSRVDAGPRRSEHWRAS